MFLSLNIAVHFHRSFKRNTLISLISLIAIIIITIGIFTSIVILSVVNGFEYELRNRILSVIPHGEIISVNTPFFNWKEILEQVKKIPNVICASPYINFYGIIKDKNKWNLAYVKSINLNQSDSVFTKNTMIRFLEQKESWQYFCTHNQQIILGKGLSIALQVKQGDWITMFFSNNRESSNKLLLPKSVTLQVSGILNLHSQLDEHLAIISLIDAQNCYDDRFYVDGIEFSVSNIFAIQQIIQKIQCKIHGGIKIRSWMDTYGYIYRDIQIIRRIIYLSIVLIMGMSCISIIATVILSVKRKHYDIAILKTIGARNILIQNIFLWYGFIIYGISSVIGTVLGVFFSLNLPTFSRKCFSIFSKDLCPKEVYFIDFVPCKLHLWDVVIVLIIVLLLGMLVSWYASLTVKKINFIQILK